MPVDGTIQLAYQDTAWFNDPLNAEIILKEGQHVYLSDGADEFLSAYVVGDGVTELQDLPWKGLIYPSGVQSVTGTNVDNTDPNNPIINAPTLQEVTTEGGTTTNPMTIVDGLGNGVVDMGETYLNVLDSTALATLLEVDRVNDTVKILGNDVATVNDIVQVTTSTIGAAINGASSATPNDTDLVMSVESSVAKKNTWTQIKAFLKTYFDTLYTTTSAVATQITTALSGYLTAATAASTYEVLTNKQTDLTASATKYPTVDAVNAGLALKANNPTFTDYSATSTIVGWSSFTTKKIFGVDYGICKVWTGEVSGTSDSVTATLTIPDTQNASHPTLSAINFFTNNGAIVTGRSFITSGTNTVTFSASAAGAGFTATGTKTVRFQFIIFP